MKNGKITLGELFKGHEAVLNKARKELRRGMSAKSVAENVIRPIIAELSANAGQEMDSTYVAYMVQYALSRTGKR